MCNTNVDGRQKVMYALTSIKGIGRRFSNIICKKCDIPLNKRAGELDVNEINKIVAVLANHDVALPGKEEESPSPTLNVYAMNPTFAI